MKFLISIVLAIGLTSFTLNAQQSLSGKITDEEGKGLSGASIIMDGTSLGTATDNTGFFEIKNLEKRSYQVSVSFIGYKTITQTVAISGATTLNMTLTNTDFELQGIEVLGTWASANTPVTFTDLDREEFQKSDQGQDIPYLVRWTPSVVATSDAGAGVGYTGLRIRGSDPTQTNVTINGIPLNDSESQGVFWVNLPDLAASTDVIQIQRGVGTSTNGAGAFGATLNIRTLGLREKAYLELDNTYGSFNTHKHTLQLGTGKMKNKLAFDARASLIQSDGYVDRASSDLKGLFLSGGYYGDQTVIRAMALIGKERTYQSWYGTPQGVIEGDAEEIERHASYEGYSEAQLDNIRNADRRYNFYLYENEVDDYQQDHYQVHLTHQINTALSIGGALHYTYGRGFFEQYRSEEELAFYQITPDMIGGEEAEIGDVVRRRWLDNDFYGLTYNLNYQKDKLELIIGGAANQYNGDHFGHAIRVITDREFDIAEPRNYYFNKGKKRDVNLFAKANYQLSKKLNLFADLQGRNIDYQSSGNDNDLQEIDFDFQYNFFNPKVGLTYNLDNQNVLYSSFAIGQREPLRSDFTDAPAGVTPKSEKLADFELGYKYSSEKLSLEINLYNMAYKNQLVQTGELNDVGAVLRSNVDDSYRRGIELQWDLMPDPKFNWRANVTLSQNKIKDFQQVVYDYTNGFDVIINTFQDTDISFSPSLIAANEFAFRPMENFFLAFRSKYVGKQFLDNTQSDDKSIEAYFTNDFLANYQFSIAGNRSIELRFSLHNVFNNLYSANGYTYTYVFGESVTENFFYPQAGIHYMLGLRISL